MGKLQARTEAGYLLKNAAKYLEDANAMLMEYDEDGNGRGDIFDAQDALSAAIGKLDRAFHHHILPA